MSENRLGRRLEALATAGELAAGRSDDAAVAKARTVVERAGARVSLSGSHTVIAIAGSTGSGKSSLFNALSGTELAEVAVRRPTTSKAMAATWGTKLPHELLDWLDITKRHLIASGPSELSDLVLLDLPDHDSAELGHRLNVDRLVELVDALIWVVDPQKYADAALHDGYLRPLASHAEVMLVVLNQVDLLTPDQLDRCVADLRRLLDDEGLRATPLIAVSAATGRGIAQLRESLAQTAANKQAMTRRLAADVGVAAEALSLDLGPEAPARVNPSLVNQVNDALADAAGVRLVAEATRDSWRRRGAIATGWPLVSWIGRIKPDPLKRFRLELAPAEPQPTEVNRTSLPPATAVQKALVDKGMRVLVDHARTGLPSGWGRAVESAVHANDSILADRLDKAVAEVGLERRRWAWWWPLIGLLQWVLIIAAVAGAVFLFAGSTLASLGVPPLPQLSWYGYPLGFWLLAGGVAGGLLLAGISRLLVWAGAARHAAKVRHRLSAAVASVVAELVIAPLQAELDRYHQVRAQLRIAATD